MKGGRIMKYVAIIQIIPRIGEILRQSTLIHAVNAAIKAGTPLKAEEGTSHGIPSDLAAKFEERTSYLLNLQKKGILWTAGPFSDFSGGLMIYEVQSIEEAKKAVEEDPFYVQGFFSPQYTLKEWHQVF